MKTQNLFKKLLFNKRAIFIFRHSANCFSIGIINKNELLLMLDSLDGIDDVI